MMGHRGLQIAEGDLGPLLSVDAIEELQGRYIQTLRNNITEWMSKSMSTDQKVPSYSVLFDDLINDI